MLLDLGTLCAVHVALLAASASLFVLCTVLLALSGLGTVCAVHVALVVASASSFVLCRVAVYGAHGVLRLCCALYGAFCYVRRHNFHFAALGVGS